MSEITKLADMWLFRDDLYTRDYVKQNHINVPICADELTAALPKWTHITTDPATWPEDKQQILFKNHGGRIVCDFFWVEYAKEWYVAGGIWWRPLCDLDYPPENKDETR